MASRWEPPEQEMVEIEARPSPERPRRAPAGAGATSSTVAAARRAAIALRVVAWSILAISVLGYVLVSFWAEDDDGFVAGQNVRQRIGELLVFIWVPLAIAALVYATSFLVAIYAARLELDSTELDERRG